MTIARGPVAAADIPAILAEWRRKGGLSQESAAALLGVSRRTYEGWEHGRSMPYPRILVLALQAFVP